MIPDIFERNIHWYDIVASALTLLIVSIEETHIIHVLKDEIIKFITMHSEVWAEITHAFPNLTGCIGGHYTLKSKVTPYIIMDVHTCKWFCYKGNPYL